MNQDELKQALDHWVTQHYPQVDIPNGEFPLGPEKLLHYYEHMEIAMLELDLHDVYPDYMMMIRKRRYYLRRLQGGRLTREQFRSLTAF